MREECWGGKAETGAPGGGGDGNRLRRFLLVDRVSVLRDVLR